MMNPLAWHDPFEQTPAAFHERIEDKLAELRRAGAPARRPRRWGVALAVCLVLLCGTSLAAGRLGVYDFLTQRVYMGKPVNASAIAQPTAQHCDSALIDAVVQDAYWDGETLSLTVSLQPMGDYALYTETDRGCDGEHFDLIWWKGEILDYQTWRAGREAIMLRLPELTIDGEQVACSWDWVQDGQGEVMLLAGHADDLTGGAKLCVRLSCVLEASHTTETAALTATLPPMTKGDDEI